MSPPSTGAEIRFATRQDAEPVCRLLTSTFGHSQAFWRSMLEYPWLSADEKPHYGAVLMVNGEACGFNGAMFADRVVDGRVERFASGFGWCVRPEYRRYAVALLAQLTNFEYTWTNLTSREDMVPLFKRMGYSLADTRSMVCHPGVSTFLRRHTVGVGVVQESEITEALLGPVDFRIYGDHFMRTVQRTVFEAGGETCLVITKRRYIPGRFRGLPATELFYSSDRAFVARHFDQVLLKLLRRDKSVALLIEERLIDHRPKGAGTLPVIPLFRSPRVTADKIDSLYTELVLLPEIFGNARASVAKSLL